MLGSCDVVGFVPTSDLDRARRFYVDVLGTSLVQETPVAAVLDAHGTEVRVTLVPEFSPFPFTLIGWTVPDIAEAVADLAARGVDFEHFPGLEQDELGVWTSPDGVRVAWFKDPDGNVLSLTQRSHV